MGFWLYAHANLCNISITNISIIILIIIKGCGLEFVRFETGVYIMVILVCRYALALNL